MEKIRLLLILLLTSVPAFSMESDPENSNDDSDGELISDQDENHDSEKYLISAPFLEQAFNVLRRFLDLDNSNEVYKRLQNFLDQEMTKERWAGVVIGATTSLPGRYFEREKIPELTKKREQLEESLKNLVGCK